MLVAEMAVPHRHRQGLVTKDLLERRERASVHDPPTGEVVARVVEAELGVELGCLHRLLEGLPDGPDWPYAAFPRPRQAGQDVVHHLPHGYLSAAATLGDLKPDDPSTQIHPIPGEPEQLRAPAPTLEG